MNNILQRWGIIRTSQILSGMYLMYNGQAKTRASGLVPDWCLGSSLCRSIYIFISCVSHHEGLGKRHVAFCHAEVEKIKKRVMKRMIRM